MKNYSEELELDQDTDILLFSAVEQMLNYADSFFENQVVEDQEVNDQAELYRSSDHLKEDLSGRIVWKTETQNSESVGQIYSVNHVYRWIHLFVVVFNSQQFTCDI